MAEAEVNGVRLYYELHGSGEPLALVHGAWVDATAWRFVVPGLAQNFRVLSYDRRGHSRSERPATQGSFDEDGDDLAALLEALDLAPAHVVTNSGGGNIALRLATRRPDVFRSLSCHEPALWGLLEQDPECQEILQQGARSLEAVGSRIAQGDHEGAARQFVEEVAFGPGAWDNELPPEARAIFVGNAPTALDELHGPNPFNIDEEALSRLKMPVRLTDGSESPPVFPRVIDRLVELILWVTRETIEGAAHVPQVTMPERYVEVTTRGVRSRGSEDAGRWRDDLAHNERGRRRAGRTSVTDPALGRVVPRDSRGAAASLMPAVAPLHLPPARFEGGLTEVGPGIHAWLQPNGLLGETNAGLVIGDGASLLVDTLWDPRLTRRMLAAMAPLTAEGPVETVVNTHSDGDHWWGNQEVAGAEIVATEAAAAVMAEESPADMKRFGRLAGALRLAGSMPVPYPRRGDLGAIAAYMSEALAPFAFEEVRLVPPTRTFSGELELDVGGREVRLIEVGPAHTPGDLIVWVPDARIAIAADILFIGVTPIMWAGPLAGWVAALERLLELEAERFVPGHGPVCGPDEVRRLIDYWRWLERAAGERLEAGRSPAATARELVLGDEIAERGFADWLGPERALVSVGTIDAHRRGIAEPPGPRQLIAAFSRMALLARDLDGRNS